MQGAAGEKHPEIEEKPSQRHGNGHKAHKSPGSARCVIWFIGFHVKLSLANKRCDIGASLLPRCQCGYLGKEEKGVPGHMT